MSTTRDPFSCKRFGGGPAPGKRCVQTGSTVPDQRPPSRGPRPVQHSAIRADLPTGTWPTQPPIADAILRHAPRPDSIGGSGGRCPHLDPRAIPGTSGAASVLAVSVPGMNRRGFLLATGVGTLAALTACGLTESVPGGATPDLQDLPT